MKFSMWCAAAILAFTSAASARQSTLTIDDVVVSPDWSPEMAEQVMSTLGVSCPPTDSAGFGASGSFGQTLTLECLANNALIGSQVRLSVVNSVELANQTVSIPDTGGGTAQLQLHMFAGNIWVPGSPPHRVNVLGYALTNSSTVDVNGSSVTMTTTTYHPVGVSITPSLASAYISQLKDWKALALQDSGGPDPSCKPACQCACGEAYEEVKRLCANTFLACASGVLVGGDLFFFGTCVVGCAFIPPPGNGACFMLCSRLVGTAMAQALAECLAASAACYLGAEIGHDGCLELCD